MSVNRQERVVWLDSCKGFAMILVVIGHIMSGYRSAGLFEDEKHIINALYNFIYSFHMALFFCISGSVFYMAYVFSEKQAGRKYKTQVINLVIAYFVFSILQWGFKVAFSSSVNEKLTIKDLLLMPISPMSPYWYLWDLVFFYILFYRLCKSRLKDGTLTIISFLISIAGSFVPSVTYNIRSCPFYLFLFWMGIYLAKTEYRILADRRLTIGCLLILCITIYIAVTDKADVRNIPLLSLISAIGISYLLLWLFASYANRHTLKGLDIIGRHSLEIYVTHCFITAANRKILIKLGITNFYINVLINMITAIVIPVTGALILKRLKINELIFRPATWWSKRKSRLEKGTIRERKTTP